MSAWAARYLQGDESEVSSNEGIAVVLAIAAFIVGVVVGLHVLVGYNVWLHGRGMQRPAY